MGWGSVGKTTFIRHLMKKGFIRLQYGAKHTTDPLVTATNHSLRKMRCPVIYS